MPPNKLFSPNDDILVLDKVKLYKAKVLKVQSTELNQNYFIHYDGWSRKFDTWIDSRICCAVNDEAAQKLLLTTGSSQPNGVIKKKAKKGDSADDATPTDVEPTASSTPLAETAPVTTGVGKAGKKRAYVEMSSSDTSKTSLKDLLQDDLIDTNNDDLPHKIPLIVPLKRLLIEDWTCITKEPKKLLRLPKQTHTVDHIIEDFLSDKLKQDKGRKEGSMELYPEYKELTDGLRDYFNQALSKIVLYRQEIGQYEVLLKVHSSNNNNSNSNSNNNSNSKKSDSFANKFKPSQVYGIEHLLRLFVRLPRLMIGMSIAKEEIAQIIFRFTEFLKFVHKHISTYSDMNDYIPVEEALVFANQLKV